MLHRYYTTFGTITFTIDNKLNQWIAKKNRFNTNGTFVPRCIPISATSKAY